MKQSTETYERQATAALDDARTLVEKPWQFFALMMILNALLTIAGAIRDIKKDL